MDSNQQKSDWGDPSEDSLDDPELESAAGKLLLNFVGRILVENKFRVKFSENLIKSLHKAAGSKWIPKAGEYRRQPRAVGTHTPPKALTIESYVREACELTERFFVSDEPPFEIAAFVLWRVNWIHPFIDGNGRVARACAYIALCRGLESLVAAEFMLGMQEREDEYILALESAHERWRKSEQDFSDVDFITEKLRFLLEDILH